MLELIIAMYTQILDIPAEPDLGYYMIVVCGIVIPLVLAYGALQLENLIRNNI